MKNTQDVIFFKPSLKTFLLWHNKLEFFVPGMNILFGSREDRSLPLWGELEAPNKEKTYTGEKQPSLLQKSIIKFFEATPARET